MEKSGRLHPTLEDGVNLFDLKEVAKVRAELQRERATSAAPLSKGEIAAACFERFRQGFGIVDIVIELKLPPSEVRALFRDFLTDDMEQVPPSVTSENRDAEGAEQRARLSGIDDPVARPKGTSKQKWRRGGPRRSRK